MTAPRKRRKRDEWERLLAELRSSGQGPVEFARAKGIALSTLHTWMRRTAEPRTKSRGGERGLFAEVRVVGPRVAGRPVEVVVSSRCSVRMDFDPNLLREVLKVVASC